MKLNLVRKLNVGASARYSFRVFLSLLPKPGGFVGVIREHDPTDPGRKTDVRRLDFDFDGQLRRDEIIMKGEDPRIFIWNGRACFLTWLANSNGDWHHWLVDLDTKFKVQLRIKPWMFHGKNWVPIVCHDRLLILRSLDPLVVLEVDDKTGICRCIHGRLNHQTVGEYRGGGRAVCESGMISGFGHRTRHADEHTVFHYSIDTKTWIIRRRDIQVLGVSGMGIIDPTSQWNEYVACCATKGRWSARQPAVHGIFRIEEPCVIPSDQ